MKVDNEQELLAGLIIMKCQLNVLIRYLEETSNYKNPRNKQLLRNITLDLREIYKSYYLDKKGE